VRCLDVKPHFTHSLSSGTLKLYNKGNLTYIQPRTYVFVLTSE